MTGGQAGTAPAAGTSDDDEDVVEFADADADVEAVAAEHGVQVRRAAAPGRWLVIGHGGQVVIGGEHVGLTRPEVRAFFGLGRDGLPTVLTRRLDVTRLSGCADVPDTTFAVAAARDPRTGDWRVSVGPVVVRDVTRTLTPVESLSTGHGPAAGDVAALVAAMIAEVRDLPILHDQAAERLGTPDLSLDQPAPDTLSDIARGLAGLGDAVDPTGADRVAARLTIASALVHGAAASLRRARSSGWTQV